MVTFSKSRLATYVQCPEKYRLHYDIGLKPIKTSPSLVEGSAIHHMVETGLMEGPDALPKASKEFWEFRTLEMCDYPDLAAYQNAQATCLEQAKAFLDLIGHLKVQEIEAYLKTSLIHPKTGVEVPGIELQGYIDILDMIDGSQRIIDLKTTAKKPMANASVLSIDLTVYAYLTAYPEFKLDGDIPVALLYLVRTKIPKIIWQKSKRTLDDLEELFHLVLMIATAIETRQFWKNPGMHCSWCDYQSVCYQDEEGFIAKFGEHNLNFGHQERDALYC